MSLVYSGMLIIVSALVVLGLSTIESPDKAATTSGGVRVTEIAAGVFGLPLATGFALVSLIFGQWKAFHQGEILLLIPLISVVIDTLLIFLVWEFFHRRWSQELKSDSTLHINR